MIKEVEYHVWQDGAIISLGEDATRDDVELIRNWWQTIKEGELLPSIIAGAPVRVIEHTGTFRDKEPLIMTSSVRAGIYDLFLGE